MLLIIPTKVLIGCGIVASAFIQVRYPEKTAHCAIINLVTSILWLISPF